MFKVYTEIENNLPFQRSIYLGTVVITGVLSITELLSGNRWWALLAALFCTVMLYYFIVKRDVNTSKTALVSALILLGFLAMVSVDKMISNGQIAEHWCYAFPLLAFFLSPIRFALYQVGLYSILLLSFLLYFYTMPDKSQILINYIFCLLLACAFAYLREERERELQPLRRTDTLTLGSTLEHLNTDLNREIQRSEREGSALSVLALEVDHFKQLNWNGFGEKQGVSKLLRHLGRLLHEHLRLFESYYRCEGSRFLIILPHTTTSEAVKKAESLRINCKRSLAEHGPGLSVSIGVAGLNVGDNTEILLNKAWKTLEKTQNLGSNRTQTYAETDFDQGMNA